MILSNVAVAAGGLRKVDCSGQKESFTRFNHLFIPACSNSSTTASHAMVEWGTYQQWELHSTTNMAIAERPNDLNRLDGYVLGA